MSSFRLSTVRYQAGLKYDIVGGPGFTQFVNHYINKYQRNAEKLFFTIRQRIVSNSRIKFAPIKLCVILSTFGLEDGPCKKFLFQGVVMGTNQNIRGYYHPDGSKGWIEFL